MSSGGAFAERQKRMPIPENSVRPLPAEKEPVFIFNPETLHRQDSRYPEHLRPVQATFGVVPDAQGSCFYEVGGRVKILAVVQGARPITRSQARGSTHTQGLLTCQIQLMPGCFGAKRLEEEKVTEMQHLLAELLQSSLEPAILLENIPGMQLDLCVSVVEADGDLLAHVINGCTLALLVGSVPMRDTVVAVTAVLLKDHPIFLLDPTKNEQSASQLMLQVAWLRNRGEFSLVNLGKSPNGMDLASLQEVLNQMQESCESVYARLKQILADHLQIKNV